MSYLDVPRIHFSGDFYNDPATLNNDVATFRLIATSRLDPSSGDVLRTFSGPDNFSPQGTLNFALGTQAVGSTPAAPSPATAVPVLTAVDSGGRVVDANARPNDDVIGGWLRSTVNAKIVDLDPEAQALPTLYGLSFQLIERSGNVVSLIASQADPQIAEPVTTRDFWRYRRPVPTAFGRARIAAAAGGASFQFSARVTWPASLRSVVLQQLRGACPDNRVWVKFTLFQYDSGARTGKIVGKIGPFLRGESPAVDCPRLMAATECAMAAPPPTLYDVRPLYRLNGNLFALFGRVPFKVVQRDRNRSVVVVDLANGIPEDLRTSSPFFRTITLRIQDRSGTSPRTLTVGRRPFTTDTVMNFAGVIEFPLSPDQARAAQRSPFELLTDAASVGRLLGGPLAAAYRGRVDHRTPFVRERADGIHVEPAEVAVRLEAGTTGSPVSRPVAIHASRFGAPASGLGISVAVEPGVTHGLAQPVAVTLPAAGAAQLTLLSDGPPNPPRVGVDGRVMEVLLFAGSITSVPNYLGSMMVRVFDPQPPVASPSWSDVRRILLMYDRLYPYMSTHVRIDLGSEATYNNPAKRSSIERVMRLDARDPNYMPVTRDLSDAKRALLLNFLAARSRSSRP